MTTSESLAAANIVAPSVDCAKTVFSSPNRIAALVGVTAGSLKGMNGPLAMTKDLPVPLTEAGKAVGGKEESSGLGISSKAEEISVRTLFPVRTLACKDQSVGALHKVGDP